MYLPRWKRWVQGDSCSTKRRNMQRWCVQQTIGHFASQPAVAVELWETQPVDDNQSINELKRRAYINVLWNNIQYTTTSYFLNRRLTHRTLFTINMAAVKQNIKKWKEKNKLKKQH